MNKITDLRPGRGREKRVNIFLDGRYAFSLPAEAVADEGLRIGQELPDGAESLAATDRFHRCLSAAMNYLSYRPRSEAEVEEKLQRRGFDGGNVKAVIARLKARGLIDDAAFARFWKESREAFSPRSQRMTSLELRHKGIAAELIDHEVATIDNSDSAYRAVLSRLHRWPLSDYQAFRRRSEAYLRRRGFSYEVINQTLKRIWQEHGSRSG